MSVALSHPNPTAGSLISDLPECPSTIDHLIIAHDDPTLIRELTRKFQEDSIFVCPVHQSQWSETLPSLILWAVDNDIEHVVVAGHSHGTAQIDPQVLGQGEGLKDEAPVASSRSAFDRILAGARRTEQQLRNSRTHFANQLDLLLESPEICGKECGDSFQMQALFYLADSGLFLNYSMADHSFRPAFS